jgi:hypothetical protein
MLWPTVTRSVSLFIWDPRPDFCYCQTVAGLLTWGVLSDERTGLSFTITSFPRQRNYSRFRILRDSWPYCTFSDSRLLQPGGTGPRIYILQKNERLIYAPRHWAPFSSSPTTRRITMKGILTRLHTDTLNWLCQSWSHVTTDVQSTCQSFCQAPSGIQDQIVVTVRLFRFGRCGAPFLIKGRICHLPRPNSVVYVICICNFIWWHSIESFVKNPVFCGHKLFTVLHVTLVYMCICTIYTRPVWF